MLKTYRIIGLLTVVAVASFAVLPATALAQSATDDPTSAQYDPEIPSGTAGTAENAATGASVAEEPASSGLNGSVGSLPFTGMDLIIIMGVALVLMGTGFALRRLSEPRPPRV
jgi:hypothetical protein